MDVEFLRRKGTRAESYCSARLRRVEEESGVRRVADRSDIWLNGGKNYISVFQHRSTEELNVQYVSV